MQSTDPGADLRPRLHQSLRGQHSHRLAIRGPRYFQAITGLDLVIQKRARLQTPRDDHSAQIVGDRSMEAQPPGDGLGPGHVARGCSRHEWDSIGQSVRQRIFKRLYRNLLRDQKYIRHEL